MIKLFVNAESHVDHQLQSFSSFVPAEDCFIVEYHISKISRLQKRPLIIMIGTPVNLLIFIDMIICLWCKKFCIETSTANYIDGCVIYRLSIGCDLQSGLRSFQVMAFYRHSVMVTLLLMNCVPLYADIEKERRNIYPCGQLRHITWHGVAWSKWSKQSRHSYSCE